MRPEDLESLLDDDAPLENFLYHDARLDCQRLGKDIWLTLDNHCEKSGAITAALGQSLLAALNAVGESHQKNPAQILRLGIPLSAGADFDTPLESLFYINAILEALWQLHTQQLRIEVLIDTACHGGAAILTAACADDILIGDQTRISLFGPRVLSSLTQQPTPKHMPKPQATLPQPPRLRRILMP